MYVVLGMLCGFAASDALNAAGLHWLNWVIWPAALVLAAAVTLVKRRRS